MKEAYVRYIYDADMKTKKDSEVMNLFMLDERRRVQWVEKYHNAGSGSRSVSNDKIKCTYCEKIGHEEKSCIKNMVGIMPRK
jgi:hypothetical protein